MDQSSINKQFYSAFDIYNFSEAEFDKEAFQNQLDERRKIINKLMSEFKVYLEGTESLMEEKATIEEQREMLKKLKGEYLKMTDTFAKLEIEINKIW